MPDLNADLVALLNNPDQMAQRLRELNDATKAAEDAQRKLADDRELVSRQRAENKKMLDDASTAIVEADKAKRAAQAEVSKQAMRAAEVDSRTALVEARERDVHEREQKALASEIGLKEREANAEAATKEAQALKEQLTEREKRIRAALDSK